MAMTFIGGLVAAAAMGTALYGGLVPAGALSYEILSLALALTTAITVASAVALDG